MAGTRSRAILPTFPDFGPFDPAVARVHALLTDGRLEEALQECQVARRLAAALEDRISCLFLDYVAGQALLELDRPSEAAARARSLLVEVGPGGDRFWRAKGLALLAAAEVDRGAILPALDALAEALAIAESGPPVRYHHISACSAVAGVLVRLLLFESAAELTTAATRGAARGSPADLLGPGTAVLLVRRLAEVHALWAAQLDLLGKRREAVRHHLATISAALWMHALALEAGSTVLAGCALAVEAFGTERLLDPQLARARARAALAATPAPDGLVEWLPGRVALARAAAAEGNLAEARELVAQVDRACAPRHREVWAGLVQVAAAEVEAFGAPGADSSGAGSSGAAAPVPEHPANALWREVAASGLRRLWQERDARIEDLRHRILRRELAERSERTQRELLVDVLTGLGNRRRLELELASGRVTAALFLDVDNFKQVNDRAGHAAGDDVLRRLATLLRGCCRAGDVLVRYGGDEFVLLLGEEVWAGLLGARILSRVRSEDWRAITGGVDITVSVGVARGGALTALHRSDAALRMAKQTGRDALVEL